MKKFLNLISSVLLLLASVQSSAQEWFSRNVSSPGSTNLAEGLCNESILNSILGNSTSTPREDEAMVGSANYLSALDLRDLESQTIKSDAVIGGNFTSKDSVVCVANVPRLLRAMEEYRTSEFSINGITGSFSSSGAFGSSSDPVLHVLFEGSSSKGNGLLGVAINFEPLNREAGGSTITATYGGVTRTVAVKENGTWVRLFATPMVRETVQGVSPASSGGVSTIVVDRTESAAPTVVFPGVDAASASSVTVKEGETYSVKPDMTLILRGVNVTFTVHPILVDADVQGIAGEAIASDNVEGLAAALAQYYFNF